MNPQAAPLRSFPEIIPNELYHCVIFMFEGLKLAAGDMSLSQAMPLDKTGPEETDLTLVVQEHARLVYKIAYSVLRDHHDAQDATQETFLRVMRHRKKLPEIREMRSWIARIAWRVAVSKKRKVAEVSFDEVGTIVAQMRSLTSPAEEVLLQKEIGVVLEKLIATLPKKLQQLIMLSTVEQLSPDEAGEILGMSAAAVRSHLFRARQTLREKLIALLEGHHGTR
jgi:RNA polymerase sigma-70 factor, ECF subfamily